MLRLFSVMVKNVSVGIIKGDKSPADELSRMTNYQTTTM